MAMIDMRFASSRQTISGQGDANNARASRTREGCGRGPRQQYELLMNESFTPR
jgi:hypothetical protein